MNDAADHPPIIDPASPPTAPWKQHFNATPLFILGGDYGFATSTFDFTYQGDMLLGDVEDDYVTNLGANVGTLMLGQGVYVIGAVVPEPSTWAMMLLGFAGLGFAGYGRRVKLARA